MSNECGCQCGQAHGACATEFQYAVKLVCGQVVAGPAGGTPLAPGIYWTAINVHNPDKCKDAHFRWKVVVAKPLDQDISVPVYQRPRVLAPDTALEIDCHNVMQTFPAPAPPFLKGYVVIESDRELDVVAVYTGSTGPCAANTFHTERVPARCVPVCEDLVLPLHTGIAPWQTVSPTAGQLGPVVPVNPTPPIPGTWGFPPLGSQWVSQFSTDGTSATSLTTRYYELCFELCSGFTVPAQFPIQVLVDDTAIVHLNSFSATIPYNTLTPVNVPTNVLHAGRNCLRVEVSNTHPNATGFALAGILRVAKGKCPCSG